MAEHTAGPWKVGATMHGSPAVLLAASGEPHPKGGLFVPVPICRMGEGNRPAEEVLANARRIVACVNACEGVSTESLEKITPGTAGELMALATLGPMRGVCSWCNLELYGDADPKERMRRHQAECPKHPMREVEQQRDDLVAALEGLLCCLREHLTVEDSAQYIEQARAVLAKVNGD